MLSAEQVERFVDEGFVHVASAFPTEVADRCRDEIWAALREDPHDPSTWSRPVARLTGFGTAPFREAATSPVLHEAFDQLVGPGRWLRRTSLGTIPVRFPVDADPGDDGWHLDANVTGARGEGRVDLRLHGRALLMLFLFGDVGERDAPTRIRVGSHLDVPPFLRDAGDEGREWFALCGDVVPASAHRPEVAATGRAGDVYLCHPFLVHAAQRHRGTRPRPLAQPPLHPAGPIELTGDDLPPVAAAVARGLAV